MLVRQAYRYELDPNAGQRILLAKHAGTARFAFNWGLALCKERLERKEPIPHGAELHLLWNVFRRENAPWWVEVSKRRCRRASRIAALSERVYRCDTYGAVLDRDLNAARNLENLAA